jgi:hypothetical protein
MQKNNNFDDFISSIFSKSRFELEKNEEFLNSRKNFDNLRSDLLKSINSSLGLLLGSISNSRFTSLLGLRHVLFDEFNTFAELNDFFSYFGEVNKLLESHPEYSTCNPYSLRKKDAEEFLQAIIASTNKKKKIFTRLKMSDFDNLMNDVKLLLCNATLAFNEFIDSTIDSNLYTNQIDDIKNFVKQQKIIKQYSPEIIEAFDKYLQVNQSGEIIGDYSNENSKIKFQERDFSREEIQQAFHQIYSNENLRSPLRIKLLAYSDLYSRSFPDYIKEVLPETAKNERSIKNEQKKIHNINLKKNIIPILLEKLDSLAP